MSKNSQYISTNRSKHYLKCHLIFVCKYRKKLLVGQLKEDMRSIILNIASNSDFEIEVFESDLDHIHFLIRYIPRLSITSIVRKLKQESTYHIWHSAHRSFLFNHFWCEQLLFIYKPYSDIIFTIRICFHYIFRIKFFPRIQMIFHIRFGTYTIVLTPF